MVLKNPIATGNTADIYLCDGKIVKSFKDFLPETEATYEANKQRYAHARGLAVPRVFEVTKINGRNAIIMEYIHGKTMRDIVVNDMTKLEHYINLSIDIQLKIHAVKANDFELMSDKLHKNLLSATLLNERQKNTLIRKLHGMQYEKRLCHGDFHLSNIICNTDSAVIDWVDSSAGDVKADVCRTYLLYAQHSLELAELYLRAYCEKSGLAQNDILAWQPIIAGARLSENAAS